MRQASQLQAGAQKLRNSLTPSPTLWHTARIIAHMHNDCEPGKYRA